MTSLSFDVYHNVINGQLKGADKHYYGINPFTEEKLWPVPVATEQDLDEAVAAADAAFKKWRATSVEERRKRVKDFAEELLSQRERWIETISMETGQTIETAGEEIDLGHMWMTAFAEIDLPEYVTHEDDEVKVVTKYFPLGVVAGICPWNFPVFLASSKIAAAVLTGNTIIIKPSPFSPYTELKLVELAQHFFPPGVVQALGGDDNLGPWMTKHPGIAKISFTGSTATGKRIMAAAATTLKRVTLELGGNDAVIICSDADLDTIIPALVDDTFVHAGQSCVAVKRIYVHETIYDEFITKFTAASKTLTPGRGNLSPVQNQLQYDKVKSFFDDCRKQKYNFVLGSGDLKKDRPGYFVPAAIVAKPPETSRLVREEPFGPIVPVLTWKDEEEVIERANDTDQGLGASVWSRDTKQAERIALRLEAGSVWVNQSPSPKPTALFGGIKQSGMGGEFGPLGLTHYCDARTFHFSKV